MRIRWMSVVVAVCSAFVAMATSENVEGDGVYESPGVHDPVMAHGEDGRYYVFATGVGVDVLSSSDMQRWRRESPVLDSIPQWAVDTVKGYRGHTWAPDISFHNGLWYLYYSCSTFGRNGSAIGLAVNRTLDPLSDDFRWEDRGMVIASHRGVDHWNAIDPNLVVDDAGEPYMVFGSFWDGVQVVKLSKTDFQTPVSDPVTIARRKAGGEGANPIEAPFVLHHGKYYYLFVSWDYCCKGVESTYKTVYGRSDNPDGPFYDRDGRAMTDGGGTYLYGPDDENYGVGHCASYDMDGKTYFMAHAYRKDLNGRPVLFMRSIDFDSEGWIVTGDDVESLGGRGSNIGTEK